MRKLLSTFILGSLISANSFASGDLSQKSWQEIEAQAKQEGQVVVSIWYLQPQFRTFVKEFEQQYGIKVRIPEGTAEGNINKLLAERNLEKGKMDVVAIGADAYPTVLKSGALANIAHLPQFENANHKLQGVELGEYALGFWGNQTGLAYDPMRISEDKLPQSWQEMEAYIQAHPKKFAYADPNGGASGKAFIERAIQYVSGQFDYDHQDFSQAQADKWASTWDWFIKNKDNLTRTSSNADSLTRLNDGELDIVAAWQDHLFSLQKQGAIAHRLKFYVPQFGMPAGGNVLGIAKNSPHPAASMVFVNWIVDKQTQQKLADSFGARPLDRNSGQADVLFFPIQWSKPAMIAFTKEVVSK